MATDPINARVAVVESDVRRLDTEMGKARERLHALESDRATVRLLVDQVKTITQTVETVAQRAAERAIDLALDARDEQLEERRRSRLDYRLRLVGTGVALGGFVSSLIALAVTNT